LAIVWAFLVNKSFGGAVETVFTARTHFFRLDIAKSALNQKTSHSLKINGA
jgi:hypothetical protein